jgi:RNase P/RNase MRP subunit POP5
VRARYLGIEVVAEPFPPLSSSGWERLFGASLERAGTPAPRFRVIRAEARRAIVEVGHLDLARVRAALQAPGPDGRPGALVPRRTWGTLVGAKAWLRAPGGGGRSARAAGR